MLRANVLPSMVRFRYWWPQDAAIFEGAFAITVASHTKPNAAGARLQVASGSLRLHRIHSVQHTSRKRTLEQLRGPVSELLLGHTSRAVQASEHDLHTLLQHAIVAIASGSFYWF